MRFLILFTSLLVAVPTLAARIAIDNDQDDCKNGWISMDVTVKVDGESFKFDPSCKFSFSKSFETKSNLKCKVDAGMCSAFSPRNRFEVSCDDGSRDSIGIVCESKKKGEGKCTDDGQCCAHWTAGGTCAHKYHCGDCR